VAVATQRAAEADVAAVVGPADEGDEAGPTAGAEDPSLPGSDEPAPTEGLAPASDDRI
jgi:hypothetical protein